MKTTTGLVAVGLFVLGLGWLTAGAEVDGHREHDAHVHGTASLNIAVDNGHIDAELVTPAMNLVGFEHAPRDDAEREAVASAAARLEHGAGLLVPSAAAGCRLDSAEVASSLLDADRESGAANDGHDHEHDEDVEHDEHGHEDEHDEVHSEFHAHYRFHCDAPAAIEALHVNLFEAFPGMETIELQALTAARQIGGVLTPDDNVIDLAR